MTINFFLNEHPILKLNSLHFHRIVEAEKQKSSEIAPSMYKPGSIEAQIAVINEGYNSTSEGPVVQIIRLKD